MSDETSSESTPKVTQQELMPETANPSQSSSRGQSQPREEYARRHFVHDCPDDINPDNTWMLNAIEWLRLDFLLMEKLSRGRIKADKSTEDKKATNRLISQIEKVMVEGIQEIAQLSIEAGEAYRVAILANNIDEDNEDKEVAPTSQPWSKGVIDINMEQAKSPIVDYKDFGTDDPPQPPPKTVHVSEHEATPAHPQSEEQSMLTQIMSELRTINATIQKQQVSINQLEWGFFMSSMTINCSHLTHTTASPKTQAASPKSPA
ncbi:hypothetical protein OPQ81_008430 [Rhizoctonia solani]|nr:hypothetical protein OPQ81_008430 [Rhizoctonia solani]